MALPPKDLEHWLFRLTPDEWLRAARNELTAAAQALQAREQRKGVANARRAAGMALNAVLVIDPNETWGRSYMDHLRALSHEESVEETIRHAALQLLEAPLEGPRFIRIGGGGDEGLAAAAEAILRWSDERVRHTLAHETQ